MTRRAAFLSHLDLNLYRFRLPVMKALAARGWEVYAVCPEGTHSGRFEAEGVRHAPYAIDRAGMNPLRELGVVASVARLLGDLRPDLLHTFMMKPNIYGGLAASLAGTPRTVASVTGLGSFYQDEPRGPARRAGRFALDRLYQLGLARADRVIFYNSEDLEEAVGLGICPRRKTLLIRGSGVDASRFRPRAAPRPAGPVAVLMAARLIQHKGVEVYLSAAEALKRKWGDGVVFRLAGEVDAGNPWAADPARLEDLARRGIVERLGFVDDVAAELARADVYALPSWYREGIPVSVLEAMSSGLAVVTTDSVGCRETVVDGASGLLVPPRDVAALVGALDRLIADPALRARLGAAARRRVEEIFSAERIAAAHLDAYRPLLPEGAL